MFSICMFADKESLIASNEVPILQDNSGNNDSLHVNISLLYVLFIVKLISFNIIYDIVLSLKFIITKLMIDLH